MNTVVLATTAFAFASTVAASPSFTVERVTFKSSGETLVGSFYRPNSAAKTDRLPAVVVTGAWMTVKEQMPANYAVALAERGFSALTFDFRGWGESAGARRQFEDPAAKIGDIRAAFAYLATRPDVAAERLGGLGICASSGYMVHAAAADRSIRSVGLVAPWLHDRELVEQIYGGAAKVDSLLAAGDAAEAAQRSGGGQKFLPAASLTDKSAVMFGVPYYTEPSRGLIPAWRNAADPAFWRGWLTFDAMTAAPRLTQPFFMVESEAAALPKGAHKFFAAVTAPKDELWLDGVTQFDFYDRAEVVARSTDAVATHFQQTLGKTTAVPLSDSARVERLITQLGKSVDARDWTAVRAIFAADVDFDYTSVAGGQPSRLAADALVAGWQKGLGSYAQTKHNFSDLVVCFEGDHATATFTGQATHVKSDGSRWNCGGDYSYGFTRTADGWRATAARFNMRWELGQR